MRGGERSPRATQHLGWRRRSGVGEGDVLSEKGKTEVTFFFRNFPEECTAEDLRRRFEDIGMVREVIIPAKRDKWGKKFGFVRFLNRRDSQKTLDYLNRLWFGSYLLKAYVPRFRRRSEEMNRAGFEATTEGSARVVGRLTKEINSPCKRVKGRNYAEVVKGRLDPGKVGLERGYDYAVEFSSLEQEKVWLNGAFTGCLKSEYSWRDHGEEIQNEGGKALKVTEMGSNLILVQSKTEEPTEKVLHGFDEWSKFWLNWIRPWSYTDTNQQRHVWTRWIGLPLQAWSTRFFSLSCAKFGRMVEIHDITKSKTRLDEALVLVSTGLNSIDRLMDCRIDGASFKIRIEEVRCMERVGSLQRIMNDVSDSDSGSEEDFKYDDEGSVIAELRQWNDDDDGGEASVQGGGHGPNSRDGVSRTASRLASETCDGEKNNNDDIGSPEG